MAAVSPISPTGVFCLILVIAYLVINLWRRRRLVGLIERIPGPFSLPFIGNSIEMTLDNDQFFSGMNGLTQLFGRHSGICRTWLGTRPYILVTSPQFLEQIMASSKHIDKSSEYIYLRPWLGTGLLTSGGKKWHTRRKILTPAFHFKILDDFIEVFREQSDVLVERLEAEVGGDGFNLFQYITLCTLDIICETAMGRKVYAQYDSNSEYVRSVYEMGHIVLKRQSHLWLQWDTTFRFSSLYQRHQKSIKVLHGFSNRVIRDRRAQLLDAAASGRLPATEDAFGRKKRLAFLDLLIAASEDGRILSNEDIREEVDTFMFEGHDTTSAAICWCLFLIGCDPEVQQRVHDELDLIFSDDPTRDVTMTDLADMHYLECCIKEALRLYPSVPTFGRKLTEDVQLGKYRVPAGTTALIVLYQLHRNPDTFPAPETFDPDRFDGRDTSRHPFAYIPFSAGPRNCIGQKFAVLEEKTVLSTILRKYRVESVDRREDLTLLGELILRPKDGLRVRLHRR